jgi:uncharacterized protein (DUF4213/DUF364 family)
MEIVRALLASLPEGPAAVEGVLIGAFLTSVSTTSTGLASSVRDSPCGDDGEHAGVAGAGALRDLPALELARYALSADTLEASVGLATINSLLKPGEASAPQRSAQDLLAERGRGKDLAIVGHFPFADRLRSVARNLWVIERRPWPGDLPEAQAADVLPRCDVVCITGTTLANRTLQGLLQMCPKAFVVLAGPTAPLTPVLFEFGIQAICGARVVDAQAVNRRVIEGATFRSARGAGIELVTLVKP